MQDNGFKIFVTLAFLALSLWYLFPTLQNYFMEQRIDELPQAEQVDYLNDNYTEIRDVRERALKLGLDLQGGMHVTLEVRMDALIRALATDIDAAFEQALVAARDEANATGDDFVEIFVDTFEEQDPNVRLSRYFRNAGANITAPLRQSRGGGLPPRRGRRSRDAGRSRSSASASTASASASRRSSSRARGGSSSSSPAWTTRSACATCSAARPGSSSG